MTGYMPGLQTVPLIKAVHDLGGESLAEAKRLVEGLIAGKSAEVRFATERELAAFRRVADELGVKLE
jgi:ribosomal protein L7/L12